MENQQLQFLQEKIQEIGSAIFFNLSDAVLKLPTSIVTTLKVDDMGYIWFFIQRPKQLLSEFEKEFPVRMDFFRKGKDFTIKVCGKGYMVNDPEELAMLIDISEEVKQKALNQMVLVKVKLLTAEYCELETGEKVSWLQVAFSTLQSWFWPSTGFRPVTYHSVSQAS